MDTRERILKRVTQWCRMVLMGIPLGLLILPVARAETVSLLVEEHVLATAEYRAGNEDKPAILMLHGFLQTRNFPTVARLADSLHELGFSVLSPTLSLGITTRNSSLPCEAIQTHSMEQGVAEIGRWVQWLQQQGHKKIVLIGHSAGSVVEVAYLSQSPPPEVSRAILVSLSYFGQGKAAFENSRDAARAQQALADKQDDLDTYSLAFCKKYVSLPADFLSYYNWSKEHTLKAMQAIRIPVTVLTGGNDDRMDREWISDLESINIDVITVPGANHFFDQEHEFDLLGEVEEILDSP